ncbi:MAG TPA: hypothetical protein VE007_04415 [Thermoanaerobaculia bacterium]|nr:hypothetical protein [Thermoanaerobaculia bacterium]
MKKKLGALLLTVSALVVAAGCASSGAACAPDPPKPTDGETWARAGSVAAQPATQSVSPAVSEEAR